jgi:DNA transformation protein and related proteins
MTRGIADLPNLGPYMERHLREIGVTNEDELRQLGAVDAYRRLKFQFGRAITLNALWALDAALAGMDWRHLGEARKAELRALLGEEKRHCSSYSTHRPWRLCHSSIDSSG